MNSWEGRTANPPRALGYQLSAVSRQRGCRKPYRIRLTSATCSVSSRLTADTSRLKANRCQNWSISRGEGTKLLLFFPLLFARALAALFFAEREFLVNVGVVLAGSFGFAL